MIKWRCVNSLFYYCKGTPTWSKKPEFEDNFVGDAMEIVRGECKCDYKTCKRILTLSDVYGGG